MDAYMWTKIEQRGRFRAIRHTGHTLDEFGNIVKHGVILQETPFGRNKITLKGFEHMLTGGFDFWMVAGSSNAAPSESNTTLGSYKGKTNDLVSAVTTRNTTPDGDGYVWWRTTYRMTFNPTSLGTGAVNISEAGVVSTSNPTINSATPVDARGLLVDNSGNPTTVSLNADIEYLDLIWEYTEYVKVSVTGTTNHTIFGVVTAIDWEVRPCFFENVGGTYNGKGWKSVGSATVPGFVPIIAPYGDWDDAPTQARSTNGLGSISSAPANDSGIGYGLRTCNAFVADDYVTGSKQRTMKATWLPSRANITGGIRSFMINCGHSQWQISYDPKWDKTDDDQLDLNFTLSMGNKA